MAGNNGQWQGDNGATEAAVEADNSPRFSGEDIEFESFMFDGGSSTAVQVAPAAVGSDPLSTPAGASLDAVPMMPQMAMTPAGSNGTSGSLAVHQPDDFGGEEANGQVEMPALGFAASGPIDVAPVDPADWAVPVAAEFDASLIAGEDVPMPSHLQSGPDEIPPFVPQSSIPSSPLRTTGSLSGALVGMGDTVGAPSAGEPVMSMNASQPLVNEQEFDGWTDDSLSAVEDFSSVLIAMQAGTQFPLTGGVESLQRPHTTGPVSASSAPAYEGPTQSLDGVLSFEQAPQAVEQQAQPEMEAVPDTLPQVEAASAPVGQAPAVMTSEAPPEYGDFSSMQDAVPVDSTQAYGATEPTLQAPAPDVAPAEPVTLPVDMASVQAPAAIEAAQVVPAVQEVEAAQPLPSQPLAPPQDPSISEGRFAGAEMEFESFMFTSPVQAAEAPVPPQSRTDTRTNGVSEPLGGQSSGGPTANLPFWLQTEQPAAPSASSPAQGSISPPSATPEEAAQLKMASAPPMDDLKVEEYLDLPPITPFDFSLLGHVEEEEELGFNASELEGMIPADQVSSRVTTDLGALADLLGTTPPADALKYQREATGSSDAESLATGTAAPADQKAVLQAPENQADAEKPDKAKGTAVLRPDDEHAPSWTSTVTSSLAGTGGAAVVSATEGEAEENRPEAKVEEVHEVEEEPAVLVQPFSQAVTDALNAPPELEIDPFDYSDLELGDEETATEQLANASSTSVLDTSAGQGLPTTPVLMPPADQSTSRTLPWDDGDTDHSIPGETSDGSTSVFSSSSTRTIGAKSTGWLSDTDGQPIEEDMTSRTGKGKSSAGKQATGAKARVARSTTERKRLDVADA
ncbi:MAG TPA: hypothetical protein VM409_04165, partial [Chloroflexia bacterium]|nr:hypothetical protein [Chloroflexia bacterium]